MGALEKYDLTGSSIYVTMNLEIERRDEDENINVETPL